MLKHRTQPSEPFEPDIPVAIPASEEHYNMEEPNELLDNSKINVSGKVIGAAAVAGGVAGLVVAGPVLGIVGAVGTGVLATENSIAGSVARASGDVVLSAKDRAKKINEKHHVVDKTKKATKKATSTFVSKAKELEKKHHIGKKTNKVLKQGLETGLKLSLAVVTFSSPPPDNDWYAGPPAALNKRRK
ncbi:hypothetical protein CTEN210_11979 [Chaetoceros tenuissimus]|uniref:Uncharacterized protein n=1 Tax=Chaetoceros tenuissimus TaxID=426638 RepID=A0AAD3HA23_9STRA|nr:hypothetical protein CTEN210_11979 [Chaetoceros tenuissimus]